MMVVKPKVFKRGGKLRYGRGFSRKELKTAGLSLKEALEISVSVDLRRRTVHEGNVEAIKTLLENKKPISKSKRKSKS